MSEFYDAEPVLVPIGSEFARRYRRYGAETDDMCQELRVWVFKHPTVLARWSEEDPESVDKRLGRTLRNEAKRYGETLKAQVLGYQVQDNSYYSKNELKILLNHVFDDESWMSPPVSEDGGRRNADPATGGNWLAILSDVAKAFEKLSAKDQHLLHRLHRDGCTTVEVAEESGISQPAVSQARDRALGRLLNLLGGERPKETHDQDGNCECGPQYVGQRRAMSNAAARATTQSTYDED